VPCSGSRRGKKKRHTRRVNGETETCAEQTETEAWTAQNENENENETENATCAVQTETGTWTARNEKESETETWTLHRNSAAWEKMFY
jgi:hypothetical protein